LTAGITERQRTLRHCAECVVAPQAARGARLLRDPRPVRRIRHCGSARPLALPR
jgi:hypothetical protein